MRRDYRETWTMRGTIFDAIAAMRDRIEALSLRKPRVNECSIDEGEIHRMDGVQDHWAVTLDYEAEDPA